MGYRTTDGRGKDEAGGVLEDDTACGTRVGRGKGPAAGPGGQAAAGTGLGRAAAGFGSLGTKLFRGTKGLSGTGLGG